MPTTLFGPKFSQDANAFVPSAIRALAPLINDPGVISFAAGVPNPETFPAGALLESCQRVLSGMPSRVLQYDVTAGFGPLREKVAGRSQKKGIPTDAGGTLLTTGSQQALDLAARVLLDPGDVVLVEVPTYVGALVTIASRRAVPKGIRRNEDGIDIAHLEETVATLREAGRNVKALYTIPNFQNPSGLSMTREAKEALAAAAERLDLAVFEDDPYGELSFDSSARGDFSPLAARIPHRTVYAGSFSKTLSAGLRVGWLHAPSDFVRKAELAKQASDLCSSTFNAAVLEDYLAHNDYDAHLLRLREFYRDRKEILMAAIRESFPPGTWFSDPAGGLFAWGRLPEGLDSRVLLSKAVAEARVAYVPGEPFIVEGEGRPFLRLTFAKEPPGKLVEGARRLGEFFRTELG